MQYTAQTLAKKKNLCYICIQSAIYYTMDYTIIKERRNLLGLTQQDLSDYTGLSVRFIKSVETGKANPSISSLTKITDILGLELVMKVKEINV